jgi:DNA-binding winged helix-turn-helix (wHTH) protein/DNA-binding CsgD family transcriptional regulator
VTVAATAVVFGDVEIDIAAHELRRGGVPVAVEPQVFEVLAYLVEHRDRMVPKTELLDEVWGDRFVSESALTSRIKAARRALGDTGREQRFIRTVHGRGYRFVAEAGASTGAVAATGGAADARAAFARRDWQAAYDGFLAVEADLTPADLDALAECAHWVGRGEEVVERYQAAYRAHLDAGDAHRAGYSAFMVSLHLRLLGEAAPADGWLARAQRVLADEPEGSAHGYPLYLETARLMGVDLDDAVASARRMQDLGQRFGDETLLALGVFFEGRARIKQAKAQEGLALLDEAMAAALSDTLQPMWTGAIYCGLLDACHELVDLRRAHEWTEATQRWCDPLPAASLYPGICRVHTAEMLQLQGEWAEAETAALGVCDDMSGIDVFAMADAFYAVGEIRSRRGDLDGAEEAYAQAHALGRDPQPGLAMLRLVQGRVDAAASSIAAALAGFGGSRLEKAPLLATQVLIALRAGDLDLAEASADEVAATAEAFGSPGLTAAGHRCTGAVALARGQTVVALAALRMALTAWQELDAPHEVACTRVLVSQAYEALGDADAAERERNAARAVFERLGATTDLCALDEVPPAPTHGLSTREVEVLGLLATGATNQQIAETLFLSDRTVARHVSNIFAKLGVSSRSAATAFAYSNGLVGQD